MKNNILMDVPNEKPEFPIPINDVGISNQKVYVKIADPFDITKYCDIFCDIEINITLPADKRGIHMSRVEQALYESTLDTYVTLSHFSQLLSRKIFNTQSCHNVKTKLSGVYLYKIKTPETKLNSNHAIKILSEVNFDGKHTKNITGIEVDIIIACPCLQRYYSTLFEDKYNQHNKSTSKEISEQIAKLVTHTQKGKLILKIEDNKTKITIKDLIKVVDSSVSLIYDLLKRSDERALVMAVLNRPQFVEDIVRKVAFEIYKDFKNSINNIEIKATSYESIHPHNVEAYLKVDIKDMERYVGLYE